MVLQVGCDRASSRVWILKRRQDGAAAVAKADGKAVALGGTTEGQGVAILKKAAAFAGVEGDWLLAAPAQL